jgi:hypothetical protein
MFFGNILDMDSMHKRKLRSSKSDWLTQLRRITIHCHILVIHHLLKQNNCCQICDHYMRNISDLGKIKAKELEIWHLNNFVPFRNFLRSDVGSVYECVVLINIVLFTTDRSNQLRLFSDKFSSQYVWFYV